MLLAAGGGAAIDEIDINGDTPLTMATETGHTSIVRLLCSYGASRAPNCLGFTAEDYARVNHRLELCAWLERSRDWSPLHYIEQLSLPRAIALLHGGADVHVGSPSPLERARKVGGEVGELVARAAGPWSPTTHELFPPAERRRAVALLRLGYLLAWGHECADGAALLDVWRAHVLPLAVLRPRGRREPD